ncbi:MAG: tetratricopeptide repeat protein [Neptuniibacter sp.]
MLKPNNKKFGLRNACSVLLISGLLLAGGELHAARGGSSATGAIDAKTFDVLTKAQELTEQGKFAEAIQRLDKIKNSPKVKGNSYAKSQMLNFYAYIYTSQERFRDAIAAYKEIIAEKDAPEGLKLQSKYTVAQIYFQIEDYTSVIKFMSEWLKTVEKPTSTAHIMLAQAYYEKQQFDNSLRNLNKAISLGKQEGKPVDENWLRMKAAIYYEKNDTKNTLATYKELFALNPKVAYLKQIAGLYGELGKDMQRLTTYDAVYESGHLQKESEVLNLAYMYLGQNVPYKAGRIIEDGIKSGLIKETPKNAETLANAWAQANEHKKAIPALERSAKLAEKGVLYARLAGVHFDAGNYKQAAAAARKANQKGGLSQPGGNKMLLGMALFNVKDFEGALQAFRGAKGHKKNFNDAHKWEKYTLSELERIRALEKSKFQLAEETEKAMSAEQEGIGDFGKNILKDSDSPGFAEK